jgi:hypothetical protein
MTAAGSTAISAIEPLAPGRGEAPRQGLARLSRAGSGAQHASAPATR